MEMSVKEELSDPSSLPEFSDESQIFAEYKDGQLQIIEVAPYDNIMESQDPESILPELDCGEEQARFLQLNDLGGKGLMHLNLLNFALVKSSDGSGYQLVSAGAAPEDSAIACLFSEGDEDDPTESYVMLEDADSEPLDPQDYLQPSTTTAAAAAPTVDVPHELAPCTSTHQVVQTTETAPQQQDTVKRKLTPVEILEKAKALQKAKSLLPASAARRGRGGRGGRTRTRGGRGLPPPLELLSSPGFKLYLYSCKLCSFKCNAVKEMSQHKKAEHFLSRGAAQCARCPYRAHTHTQLTKHHREKHTEETATIIMSSTEFKKLSRDSVCVCGACGFESRREHMLQHVAEHARTDSQTTTTEILDTTN